MVSEAEYDKNQEAFRAAQATAQGQTTQPQQQGQGFGIPVAGASVPQTLGGQENIFGQTAVDPFAFGASALGGGAPGVGAQGAAGPIIAALKSRSVQTILLPIAGFIAGGSNIVNSLIGKEWNKFASDNNLSQGNIRLAAFEQMYTTPIEVGGKWTFLFNDGVKLRERMREAGVDGDQIPGRIQQLTQQRQANIELITSIGQPLDIEALQIPGETAIQTAERVAKERAASAAVPRGAYGQFSGPGAAQAGIRSQADISQDNLEEKSQAIHEGAPNAGQFLAEETTPLGGGILEDIYGNQRPIRGTLNIDNTGRVTEQSTPQATPQSSPTYTREPPFPIPPGPIAPQGQGVQMPQRPPAPGPDHIWVAGLNKWVKRKRGQQIY